MKSSALKKNLNYILSRTFILYLGIFLISLLFINYPRVKKDIQLLQINNFCPVSFDLIKNIDESISRNDSQIPIGDVYYFIHYYKLILDTFSNRPDAHTMLALLYNYLDDHDKALFHAEQAYHSELPVLIFGYNLGLLYHQSGNYKQSQEVLINTTSRDNPRINSIILKKFFPYLQIFSSAYNNQIDLVMRMSDRKNETYILILENMLKLKQYHSAYDLAVALIEKNYSTPKTFHYYAGVSAFFSERYNKTIHHLQTFLSLGGSIYADTALYLYTSYLKTDNVQASQEFLKKAEELKNEGLNIFPGITRNLRVRFL